MRLFTLYIQLIINTSVIYFQNVGAQELIEYRDNVIKVYDKNADGKLSRDELGMLLSVDK